MNIVETLHAMSLKIKKAPIGAFFIQLLFF